ncbi:hypothetical protein ANN_08043 [Periplaneta americana]|uniref:Uncharacterized protein n=1 Tax=Periplaneta americana TaxID=6978 RepID=A0ABQ8T100_PERAM|nr:hypothetical protein ANN_08043 [Periplaneta americana]
MSPGSSTESYPAFARIGLRENLGKNLNQVTCLDRDSNPGHLVSQPDALTVTLQTSNRVGTHPYTSSLIRPRGSEPQVLPISASETHATAKTSPQPFLLLQMIQDESGVKSEVYKRKVETREKLLARILYACAQVKECPNQLRSATQQLSVRAAKGTEVDGGLFEHVLVKKSTQLNRTQVEEKRHQHLFSNNVWAGVLGDRLRVIYVVPQRLTGARYQDFLINILPTLLEYMPCQKRLQMSFMYDGTPAHFFRNECEHQTLTFQNRWIDWGGPTL